MNDLAYDISYLIEHESARTEASPPRMARPVAPPAPPGTAATQAAMARELLQAAEAHEEWIRQYLGTQGSVQCGA
ncbi:MULTISPECIES: hypothetical protein [Rhodanobacter]|uniref:hypothetical protein n=1 Tax=Rhodanobacter TaxID=75309 RepID=UPI000260CC95|nr:MULTISPECIES: hypothetical protein [Rhodanobacter]EIM00007.1 hypothetical protein UUC_14908 [Rhodanobacter denitrificans]KZC19073.1 hypothetical protein RHOFW104R3_33180 [Rhodanobacter denitrificans]UJJ50385.1 hypothetical protein LRK52_14275 [Rhodanobacter denitrificans]UJJ57432.1 hypothetical protein LRK55_12190 [Rhodanobacter denitrificans]UJM91292.1 hypothetical protein LRK24_05085 [Rhodanobacter denitrificans]